MPIEKKKLATILGYLGLIPFFTFTIIFFISNFNNYVVDVYLFYSNIILAFLCGSQWSKILNSNISNNRNLLLTLSVVVPVFSFILDFFSSNISNNRNLLLTLSVVVPVFSFILDFFSNQDIKIAVYIILFFSTNIIDGKIFSEPSNIWYLNLRKRLTFLVILTLVINLFAVNAYRFL